MEWRDRIIYHRDFAYATGRARMASGNIGDVPAATYAEYVHPPLFRACDDAMGGASDAIAAMVSPTPEQAHAQPWTSSGSASRGLAPCPAVRPGLAHRLYSDRLHVRAKAKLQRDRLLSGRMIDVYVGNARRHWSLHRNLLCHHSEQLETELDENGADKLELSDHDPAGFELFVKWLYQGKLDEVGDLVDANQKYDYAVGCHKLYLLCERFDMPSLKNTAMDQYRKGLYEAELVPDADEINDIYRASSGSSPFKRLVTRIAARQIMDPGCENDVETYRRCFEDNPDFALDLVKAIKAGTGGTLFEDPTEHGNSCEYHDHEVGPNCEAKGKGRMKSVLKAPVLRGDPKSVKFDPFAKSDPPLRHPHPTPRLMTPPPPLRHARLQEGGPGPLRRRLTSPASSTVETSNDLATATPPSPPQRRKCDTLHHTLEREVTLPKTDQVETQSPMGKGLEDPRSLRSDAQQVLDEVETAKTAGQSKIGNEQLTPPRGLWRWARIGGGRLNLLGGTSPSADQNETSPSISKSTVPDNGNVPSSAMLDVSKDDFNVPSTLATICHDEVTSAEESPARVRSLGLASTTLDNFFAQTKRSSDELVASLNGTPSPQPPRTREQQSDRAA